MNDEPVAWMQMRDDGTVAKYSPVKTWEDDVPLYTRPSKQLSDDYVFVCIRCAEDIGIKYVGDE